MASDLWIQRSAVIGVYTTRDDVTTDILLFNGFKIPFQTFAWQMNNARLQL